MLLHFLPIVDGAKPFGNRASDNLFRNLRCAKVILFFESPRFNGDIFSDAAYLQKYLYWNRSR